MAVKSELSIELQTIKSDVRVLAETMQQGFGRMDERFASVNKRFELVDKRFDDMNRRIAYMFAFMTAGFTVLMSIYHFLG